jgi:HTH-type transcriptional regulator/antitoxin HipB
MPFHKVNVGEYIKQQLEEDPEFKKFWESTLLEYDCIGELIQRRKELGLSQRQVAEKIGVKQQIISRMESHVHSVSLNTFCRIVGSLGYRIAFIPSDEYNFSKPNVGESNPKKDL